MSNTIFFSWQSDTPNKTGRGFLKEVLEEVCRAIATDTDLEESFREVSLDSDTKGVAGQPPILQTIFNKIDAAAVFVADMTFAYSGKDNRPSPNPNVLIEYGWALKSLGHSRVLWVMNTAYGDPEEKKMPFDLAHVRWPIKYSLPEDATPVLKSKEKQKLVKVLTEAILLCLKTIPTVPTPAPQPFPAAVAKDGPARFRGPGEPLGIRDGIAFLQHEDKKIFLDSGPATWLRLLPSITEQKEWSISKLLEISKNNSSFLMPLIHPGGSYDLFRASDGVGWFLMGHGHNNPTTTSINVGGVSFVFKTGEIWCVDTSILSFRPGFLLMSVLESSFLGGIEMYSKFLDQLGVAPPYHWKAGLVGIKDRQLIDDPPPGYQRLSNKGRLIISDSIEGEGRIEIGQQPRTAIIPFLEKIYEECGLVRPVHLPRE